jgi:hypothetical protein
VQITDKDIRRFQEIWREEFGKEITSDEAREQITRLDEFFLFLARRPHPSRSENIHEQ